MKLLSAFSAAVTAAALFINTFPANAETALSATVSGDLDLNSKITISDLLTMQNYLHGKSPLSEQAFLNADINGDGSADVFDMCLLR